MVPVRLVQQRHLWLLLGILSACDGVAGSESAGADAAWQDAGQDAATLDAAGALDVGTGDGDSGCPVLEPGADSDSDGLADSVEDRNRDCVVDPGETDPLVADTDGDGIPDGDEDIDRNGVYDASRGEFDPLRSDTDGDGIPDGQEPLAAVCSSSIVSDFLEYRYALAGGWPVFVPPGAPVQVLGDGEAIVFGGPADGEFTMLLREVRIALGASDILLPMREAAQALGGDAWFTVLAHSETAGAHVAELALEFPEPVGIEEFFERLVGLPVPLPTVPAATLSPVTRAHVRIEAEGTDPHSIDGRVAVWARFGGGRREPAPVCGLSCIGSQVADRAVPVCEKVVAARPAAATLLLVVEPSSVAEPVVAEIVAAVEGVLSDRAASGAATAVWIASAESHLAAAGSLPPAIRLPDGARLGDVLGSLPDLGADERVWAAARAALAYLRDEAGATGDVTVLTIALREDTEFRAGETAGRDGNATRTALLPGEQRLSRTRFYADEFRALGARWLAVAPMGVRVGPLESCASLADVAQRSGVDDGLSYTEITSALHGSRLDLCFPGVAGVVEREMAMSPGRGKTVQLAMAPIAGTVRAAGAAGVLPQAALEGGDARSPAELRAARDIDRDALGVAYLTWESATEP